MFEQRKKKKTKEYLFYKESLNKQKRETERGLVLYHFNNKSLKQVNFVCFIPLIHSLTNPLSTLTILLLLSQD